jgi:hypothetical protein
VPQGLRPFHVGCTAWRRCLGLGIDQCFIVLCFHGFPLLPRGQPEGLKAAMDGDQLWLLAAISLSGSGDGTRSVAASLAGRRARHLQETLRAYAPSLDGHPMFEKVADKIGPLRPWMCRLSTSVVRPPGRTGGLRRGDDNTGMACRTGRTPCSFVGISNYFFEIPQEGLSGHRALHQYAGFATFSSPATRAPFALRPPGRLSKTRPIGAR